MAKKRPTINLTQPLKPHRGDIEKLFAGENDVEQAAGLQLLAVRIDAIHPDPDQPRNTFPQESLEELRDSIEQEGLIQPIEVTEVRPEVYVIVHGERRWRAAKMAGLATIPAVVQRRNYDEVTRFVRQLVENIQREDLNDVDRAAGLIRLRDLLQEELIRVRETDEERIKPWSKTVSWAKVGERLGYSRQRVHQLIKLIDLPDEIKEAVRDGTLTERDTRVFQGLKRSQQRALYRAFQEEDIDNKEMRVVARLLKRAPDLTVHKAIRHIHNPEGEIEAGFSPAAEESFGGTAENWPGDEAGEVQTGRISGIQRLVWVRGHLHRVQPQTLTAAERQEVQRLLRLIEQDVSSLLSALRE